MYYVCLYVWVCGSEYFSFRKLLTELSALYSVSVNMDLCWKKLFQIVHSKSWLALGECLSLGS